MATNGPRGSRRFSMHHETGFIGTSCFTNGIRRFPLLFVNRLPAFVGRRDRGLGGRAHAAGDMVQADKTAPYHVV